MSCDQCAVSRFVDRHFRLRLPSKLATLRVPLKAFPKGTEIGFEQLHWQPDLSAYGQQVLTPAVAVHVRDREPQSQFVRITFFKTPYGAFDPTKVRAFQGSDVFDSRSWAQVPGDYLLKDTDNAVIGARIMLAHGNVLVLCADAAK